MKRRFEFEEGSSSKFWEIDLDGSGVTTWWGRIGTSGQSKTKDFGNSAKAQAEYDKLVAEKTGKGYVETGAKSGQTLSHAGAQPKPAAPATAKAKTVPPATKAPVKQEEEEDDDDDVRSSGRRRFEFEEDNSSKFWEIKLDEEEQSVTTWWGKIGTSGQSKSLDFDSDEEARSHYEKLIKEKTKKGYEEVAGSGGNGGSMEARLSEHKRNTFIPITEDGDKSVSSSKFSGIAWINSNEEWPLCGYCEKPMQLFFQLNIKDAPARRSYWPATGYIQVFYCNTEDTYCEEKGVDAFSPFGKFQVARLVIPSSEAKSFRESPVEAPLPAKTIVKWKEKADYPCAEELASRFDDPILDEDERSEMFDVSMEEPEKSLTHVSDKLDGWPMWIQGASYPECPTCETEMDFIAQIGSEDNLDYMFGDCGIAMVFQCCKHPAQLAFSWAGS